MAGFRKYVLLLGFLFITLSIVVRQAYDLPYPAQLGPQFDNFVRMEDRNRISEKQAEIVLLGDSILALGMNPAQLENHLGRVVYSLARPGSASASWYLSFKNMIGYASPRPRYVVIFFRDSILTAPGYRVNGKYFTLIDELAYRDDTLVIEKAFVQQSGPLEQFIEKYFPVYSGRLQVRETLDYYIRYGLTSLAGCDPGCNENANYIVFNDNNIDNVLLVEAIATAESYLYTPQRLDFDNQVSRSFLPDIITLAEENDIQLIFVRTKHFTYPTLASQPLALQEYSKKLAVYLEQNNIPLLDFSSDPRLTENLYVDSHHMSEQGAVVFTKIVGEALMGIIE